MAMLRPPSTYDGRTTTGKPIFGGRLARLAARCRRAARRLRDAEIPQQLREALAILGKIDRVRRRAEDPDARLLQRERQLKRRLAAELHDARHVGVALLLALDHRHHVFEGQRLEVQTIRGVVVGRHRFGIAVHHDRLEAFPAEAEHGMAAAIVELDALPDAVGAAAKNDDLGPSVGSASQVSS